MQEKWIFLYCQNTFLFIIFYLELIYFRKWVHLQNHAAAETSSRTTKIWRNSKSVRTKWVNWIKKHSNMFSSPLNPQITWAHENLQCLRAKWAVAQCLWARCKIIWQIINRRRNILIRLEREQKPPKHWRKCK